MMKKSLVMFSFFFKWLCPCEVVSEVGVSAVLFITEGEISPTEKKIPKFLPENSFPQKLSLTPIKTLCTV